jgi:hypothetical protein
LYFDFEPVVIATRNSRAQQRVGERLIAFFTSLRVWAQKDETTDSYVNKQGNLSRMGCGGGALDTVWRKNCNIGGLGAGRGLKTGPIHFSRSLNYSNNCMFRRFGQVLVARPFSTQARVKISYVGGGG